jgi:flagellar protein FliS
MFAPQSPLHMPPPLHLSSVYRQVGVQSAVSGGASPHRLVAMLFDGALEAIAQARGALRDGRVEAKGRAIGRAARIVEEGLKAGLNREAGGRLASDLDDLYAYVTLRLTQANLLNDDAALVECQRLIEPLREAWGEIAPQAAAW